jgi:hypothetical protein
MMMHGLADFKIINFKFPPLAANFQDLRNRMTAAMALVDRDMLTRVWNAIDYLKDVCRITKGAHIEHL